MMKRLCTVLMISAFVFIGVVGLLPHIGVVKNYFHNVPDGPQNVSDWLCLSPGNTSIEQYFMREA